jgi:RNA polymerase sigma-70 factor, ECF subfamily
MIRLRRYCPICVATVGPKLGHPCADEGQRRLAPLLLHVAVMKTSERSTDASRAHDDAMARYACGDDRAFTEVYAAVAPRLARFFGRRLYDRMSVSDLVQETLLRVHRARGRFVPGSPLLPWVFAIARRLLIDRLQIDGRRRAKEKFVASPPPTALPNGEEVMVAKEMAGRIDRALAGISEPQRAALRLVKGDGLSVTQAAAALRTTTTGVKLRTYRALRAVRAELTVAMAEAA